MFCTFYPSYNFSTFFFQIPKGTKEVHIQVGNASSTFRRVYFILFYIYFLLICYRYLLPYRVFHFHSVEEMDQSYRVLAKFVESTDSKVWRYLLLHFKAAYKHPRKFQFLSSFRCCLSLSNCVLFFFQMNMLTVRHGMVHRHYGRALSALLAYFEESGYSKEYYAVLIEVRFLLTLSVQSRGLQ